MDEVLSWSQDAPVGHPQSGEGIHRHFLIHQQSFPIAAVGAAHRSRVYHVTGIPALCSTDVPSSWRAGWLPPVLRGPAGPARGPPRRSLTSRPCPVRSPSPACAVGATPPPSARGPWGRDKMSLSPAQPGRLRVHGWVGFLVRQSPGVLVYQCGDLRMVHRGDRRGCQA
jgi:hypothetical protein